MPAKYRRQLPPGRPPLGRRRIALAVVGGLILAGLSFADALAHVVQLARPSLALQMAPNDPIALAEEARRSLVQRGTQAVPNVRETALATKSLQALALNGPALQLLGMGAAMQRRDADARRMFAVANRVSRRDIGVQLWMIEDAVQRGDVAGALTHYDIAMRSSKASWTLLFPVLTAAIDDADIRRAMVPYVRANPPWMGGFIGHAIRTSPAPSSVAMLVRQSGGLPANAEYVALGQELIGRLVATGQYQRAVEYMLSLPGTSRSMLTSAAMNAQSTDPRYAPLSWEAAQQDVVRTSIVAGGTGDGLGMYSTVESGQRGVIARKLLMLPPGNYVFSAEQQLSNVAERSAVIWFLNCADGAHGRELWQQQVMLTQSVTRIARRLTIPSGCPVQFLSVQGYGGGGGLSSADIVINNVRLNRAGN